MRLLDKFWFNLLASLALAAASAAALFRLFEKMKTPKTFDFEAHFAFLAVVLGLILVFGVFRLVRFFQFLKRKKWAAAVLTALQIAFLVALFWGNLFLIALPIMGTTTDMPGDGF